ncbi:MAG: homoserine dehydrogenase [Proteobacteria bacterium]|nr:homoserine dehydrogenase [Pseudomonadota bacterium]
MTALERVRDVKPPRELCIGLLGLGTVGAGVYRMIEERADRVAAQTGVRPRVKRILVNDRKKARPGIDPSLFADRFDDIVADPEIALVVEVMGGLEPARAYALASMAAGKHLVTANKALLATHGEELYKEARKRRVDLLFEAAVAGGIPIIRALQESLGGDRVVRMQGIINGTTNYIITRMTRDGLGFDEALRMAQDEGYAEADPSSDVDGLDAAYKLAVLSSIGFHARVGVSDVACEGIRALHREDIAHARDLGLTVKLIAEGLDKGDALELSVMPTLIPLTHPLASVSDAFNAVLVEGEWSGELMFYGQGAGRRPTASAVIADVVRVLKDVRARRVTEAPGTHRARRAVRRLDDRSTRFYLRLQVADEPGVLATVATILAREGISLQSVIQKGHSGDDRVEVIFLTHDALEKRMQRALDRLRNLEAVRHVAAVLRVRA